MKIQDLRHTRLIETYFEDLPDEERARLLSLHQAELRRLSKRDYPFKLKDGTEVLGPVIRFEPYKSAAGREETWRDAWQQMVVKPNGERVIMLASHLGLITKMPPRKPIDFSKMLGLEEARLKEQVDVRDVKALFHASHIGNLDSIQKFGVIPMHGEIVQWTETYKQYLEWEEKLEEVAFFSPEDPGFVNWQVGNYLGKDMWDVTVEDIRKNGLVAILYPWNHASDIYCSGGDGTATTLDGKNKVYDVPSHVEGPDCFSYEAVHPDIILTGNKLIRYLKKYFPDVLEKAEGRESYFAKQAERYKQEVPPEPAPGQQAFAFAEARFDITKWEGGWIDDDGTLHKVDHARDYHHIDILLGTSDTLQRSDLAEYPGLAEQLIEDAQKEGWIRINITPAVGARGNETFYADWIKPSKAAMRTLFQLVKESPDYDEYIMEGPQRFETFGIKREALRFIGQRTS